VAWWRRQRSWGLCQSTRWPTTSAAAAVGPESRQAPAREAKTASLPKRFASHRNSKDEFLTRVSRLALAQSRKTHLLSCGASGGEETAMRHTLGARPCLGWDPKAHAQHVWMGNWGSPPAQWCLSCVHTQARFSCKKLQNPLRKVPRKDVVLWKNCRGNAGEAARVLWVSLYGVTHKLVQRKSPAVRSRTKPIAMTA